MGDICNIVNNKKNQKLKLKNKATTNYTFLKGNITNFALNQKNRIHTKIFHLCLITNYQLHLKIFIIEQAKSGWGMRILYHIPSV